MLNTPILLIVFNRPDTTIEVFNSIRQIKPQKLFIAADGPRANNEKDATMCPKIKEIVGQVDWNCEVCTYFREENVGCAKNVSEAISWFFSKVEYGIILEDDTVPSQSFYGFCEQMLLKYQHEDTIKLISGTNFLFKENYYSKENYYFSNLPSIWGWATWRRAWGEFTFDIGEVDYNLIESRFKNKAYSKHLFNLIQMSLLKDINSWAVFWLYNFIKNNGIAISPSKNLVTNIGIEGTHYNLKANKDNYGVLNMPAYDLRLDNLHNPKTISINQDLDDIAIKNIVKIEGLKRSYVFLIKKTYALLLNIFYKKTKNKRC
jgi:hypothetical protein